MTIRKLLKTAALAGIALALFTGSAMAIEAAATTAVNVRSGPGTGFGIVDTLHTGEIVDVNQCNATNTWCHIFHEGPDGWVSRSYLGAPGSAGSSGSPIQFNVTIPLPGGGSITFGTGGVSGGSSGASGGVPAQVCFYANANYGGAESCVNAGVNDPQVTGFWNDRATSLRVFGGAKVRLCQDWNYGGGCNIFTNNVPELGLMLNNQASSYMTWTGAAPAIPGGGLSAVLIHSAGEFSLPNNAQANLDTGTVGIAGSDVWYHYNAGVGGWFLTTRHGAQFAPGDGTFQGYAGCSTASFSLNNIRLTTADVGSYACVRTSEGRISEIRLEGVDVGGIVLGYTAWAD